jgi:hypothetical protein
VPEVGNVELINHARRWESALVTLGVLLAIVALVAATAGPAYHLFDGLLSVLAPSPHGCSLGLCR